MFFIGVLIGLGLIISGIVQIVRARQGSSPSLSSRFSARPEWSDAPPSEPYTWQRKDAERDAQGPDALNEGDGRQGDEGQGYGTNAYGLPEQPLDHRYQTAPVRNDASLNDQRRFGTGGRSSFLGQSGQPSVTRGIGSIVSGLLVLALWILPRYLMHSPF